jgi:hypothetical protein
MIRAVAFAVAMSGEKRQIAAAVNDPSLGEDPARPHRPQEAHVKIEGRLELVGLERRQQGRAHGVVEHGGHECAEDVGGRVREGLGRRERELEWPSASCALSRGIFPY